MTTIDDIAARHAASKPGDWFYDGEPSNIIIWSDSENRVCFMTSNGPAEENATFIVNAHADVGILLAEITRLISLLSEAGARGRIAGMEEAADLADRAPEFRPASLIAAAIRGLTKEPAALRAQTDGGGNGPVDTVKEEG